jgi:hypothetical protein
LALDTLTTTVNGKAEQLALNTLTTTVNGKAEQTALNTLTTAVNGKADQQATEDALALKADTTALNALAETVSDNTDAITQLQGINAPIFWITSPEYDLSAHPNTNLAVRWAHGQKTEPVSVHMFVRVFNTVTPTEQYIYPYTSFKAQPRFAPVRGGTPARYVRFASSSVAFSVHNIDIFTDIGRATSAIISDSNQMANPEYALSTDGLSATSSASNGNSFLEIDLGSSRSISRIAVNATVPTSNGATIRLLDAARNILYTSPSTFLDGTTYSIWSLSGELNFATSTSSKSCSTMVT